jgi:general secretion pathway protein A
VKPTPASGHYKPHHYLEYLGLAHNPFPVAPDNTHFYISQHNDAIISKLTQAVFSRKGFMLLCGDIGLGKTTISRRIIDILEKNAVETCLVLQSFYQGNDLLREIIKDFGMSTEEIRNDLPTLMKQLNTFLLKKNQQGINCAILIDDAQNLTIESLELIRLISNLEADREKLVQIMLVGQPELLDKLNTYELRQLKSRVTINQAPMPLERSEIGKYIQFKLNRSGDPGKIMVNEKTLNTLFGLTRGNIRRINILMDQALQLASLDKTFTITPRHLKKANKELALQLTGEPDSPKKTWIILILILMIFGMILGTGLFFYLTHHQPAVPLASENISDISGDPMVQHRIQLPGSAPAVQPPLKDTADADPGQSNPNGLAAPMATGKIQKTGIEPENIPARLNEAAKTRHLSTAISDFLTTYGLESFDADFQAALKKGRVGSIQTLIFDRTGFLLIQLDHMPEQIQKTYDILARRLADTESTKYYLFWKPWLKIIKFYSGYKGEEITDLQILLKNIGLYNGNIDGIVGQIVIQSVKTFQRSHQLPVTGFPDPETIFLLAHSQ